MSEWISVQEFAKRISVGYKTALRIARTLPNTKNISAGEKRIWRVAVDDIREWRKANA